ncbi:MAG TPA: FHA domain-containing protein [Pirellulaceae bacterium]|nr:FHA domain-containing protein [Pirellulaceae bacterium]
MWLVSNGFLAGSLPFRLNPGEYIVGRAKGVAISIRDLTLSRRHARLIRDAKSLIVEDLGSRNGTFINGERVSRQTAEIGDEICFGGAVCRVAASPLAVNIEDGETTHTMQLASGATVEFDELTRAQMEVLRLVVEGLDESAIAARLNRSVHTIHTHLKAIFRQFQVHSRAELIVKAGKGPMA